MAKKIAVIDDDNDISTILTLSLEKNGFTVVSTNDSQASLKLIRDEKPDLILLDVMMPHLDGFEICRLVKFDETLKHIPVIFLTARTQGEDKENAKNVGAEDFIIKPFKQEDLLATINKYLKN